MNQKELAKKHIDELAENLEEFGCFVDNFSEKQYNFEYDIHFADNKFKLLVYFGKKGIKTVLQGKTSTPEFQTLNELVQEQPALFKDKILDDEPEEYIGSDETGKGDLFGPLVIAAVYVNGETKPKLLDLGVRDSKDLTDEIIWDMAIKISQIPGIEFEVMSVEPVEYNKVYTEEKNINKMLDKYHSAVVEKLIEKTNCKLVITDKFNKKEKELDASGRNKDVEFISMPKAEKFLGVAAASILARAKMIQWFKKNKLGTKPLPLGSSTDTEEFIKNNKELLGKIDLNNYAKLHFKTWKKLNVNTKS